MPASDWDQPRDLIKKLIETLPASEKLTPEFLNYDNEAVLRQDIQGFKDVLKRFQVSQETSCETVLIGALVILMVNNSFSEATKQNTHPANNAFVCTKQQTIADNQTTLTLNKKKRLRPTKQIRAPNTRLRLTKNACGNQKEILA